MYFKTNIKFLRKRRGRTQDDVAHALNMKRSTLSGYENGIAYPNISTLLVFSKFFNISIDTLIRIDLNELSESQLRQLESGNDVYIKGNKLRVLATTIDTENNENIELVPEKAKAGYRTGYADPEFISELPAFKLPFLSRERKYRTFHLKGDSMLPIPDGSWVTGEYVQDLRNIINGHAYIIFTMDDGIVFKVVEDLVKEKKVLRLYSLNPLYEPYDVHITDIKEMWKFVNYISNEVPDPVIPENHVMSTVAGLKQDLEKLKARLKENDKNKSNFT